MNGGNGQLVCAGGIQPGGAVDVIRGGAIAPHLVVGQYDVLTDLNTNINEFVVLATPRQSNITCRSSWQAFGWRFEFKDLAGNPADCGFSFLIMRIATNGS